MRREIDPAIQLIIQWSKKLKWNKFYHETLQLHLLPVCKALDKSEQQALLDINEKDQGGTFYALCLEDFLTRIWGPKQQNPVDDLLKYKGSKLNLTGKSYLRAVKNSELRLWEVLDVNPGEWVEIRDCLRPDDTFRVIEHSGTQSMRPWGIIGARVVNLRGRYLFTSGILMMPRLRTDIREFIQAASECA